MNGGKFMSRRYQVPLTDVILATPEKQNIFLDWDNTYRGNSSDSEISDYNIESSTDSSDDSVSDNIEDNHSDEHTVSDDHTRSFSHRIRRRPRYLDDYEL